MGQVLLHLQRRRHHQRRKAQSPKDAGWGDWERTWTFTWNGNKASVKYIKEGEEQSPLSITLGSNGFVSSFTDTWGDVRNCTYDQEGHLLKVLKGSDPKCNCVWENGDLKKWSRFSDGEEQYKIQAFYADENLGGIFADATDKAGIDRWMIEIGLFGKPSKHLLKNAVWEGSESVAELEYEKDADNYVVKATKYYDGEVIQSFRVQVGDYLKISFHRPLSGRPVPGGPVSFFLLRCGENAIFA